MMPEGIDQMAGLEVTARNRTFDGEQIRCRHASASLACSMDFSIFLPPQAASGPVPVVYWLSGLTCTDQNFVTKAGAQAHAARLGLAIVAPDTSPRGEHVPDDPDGNWDFGLGAGFYVDAVRDPWRANYQMYTYVTRELPDLVEQAFPVTDGRSICGHSMGGHGALVVALRNPDRYSSVSAFSPICAPSQCPWGLKAFGHLLGGEPESWRSWDACELIRARAAAMPLLVEQGEADNFLAEQLMPDALLAACRETGHELVYNSRPGYDHSYYFIATFIGAHLEYHARALAAD